MGGNYTFFIIYNVVILYHGPVLMICIALGWWEKGREKSTLYAGIHDHK